MTTPLTQVYAYLIFFVYNKKTDKYFTIKDTEVKRFNALRKVWGLSQVLPLETFNDPKNGYIFEGDQCEFGVDVLVAPPLTKWEVVSFDQQIPNFKFSWTLKKFVELKENFCASNKFSVGGREWVLNLYPKGDSTAEGKWMSIFLLLVDSEELKAGEKIYVLAQIRLIDRNGSSHNVVGSKVKCWYTEQKRGFGWNKFVSVDRVQAYLDNEGSLKVEIEFEVVSTTKYATNV